MTATDLLSELQSFVTISDHVLSKAMNSNLTTRNSPTLRRLADEWNEGKFDEDPELLVQEIASIL